MVRKILALVAEPISAEALEKALGRERADRAEVLVVAPALNSRLRFWFGDVDEAIERADQVQEETVERLEEEGIDAAGDTGEGDPMLALSDSLATFDADRVVVFAHPEQDEDQLEGGWIEAARSRFDVPIEHRQVTRSPQDPDSPGGRLPSY